MVTNEEKKKTRKAIKETVTNTGRVLNWQQRLEKLSISSKNDIETVDNIQHTGKEK